MIPEKQPAQMVVDQLALLKSEERKLKKFINYNQDAKPTVDLHLQEIQEKKQKLYRLCEMMGIKKPEEDEKEPAHYGNGIPQPTGRFGSRLISWHK